MKMNYKNKPNPDDRSDNVEKLQEMIANTDDNIRKSEATMSNLSGEELAQVEAKNERRRESMEQMRAEIKDENSAR
jgi:small acid-soluble spore protein (thioredoxin-like protein)